MNFNVVNAILGFVSSGITILLAFRSIVRYISLRSRVAGAVPTVEYSFPNLLATDTNAANVLQLICEKLSAFGKRGRATAERIQYAAEHLDEIGQSSLNAYLDPPKVLEDVEEEGAHITHVLVNLRNILILLPLLLTWGSLGLAATQYQSLVSHNPSLASTPFLVQWQAGFGTGNPVLSFTGLAVVNVLLLLVVTLLSVYIGLLERRTVAMGQTAQHLVVDAISTLLNSRAQSVTQQAADTRVTVPVLLDALSRHEQALQRITDVLTDLVGRLELEATATDASRVSVTMTDQSSET